METYYTKLMPWLEGYTVQGLFDGNREIKDIVTLQEGNKGKIFFFDQEPILKDLDIELWDHIFLEPTILANSELDSKDKEWLANKYPNFVDWYFFSHALVSREWFAHYKYLSAGNYGNHDKLFLFDFGIITKMRQYRLYLFKLLGKNFLDNKAYYSIDVTQDWKNDLLEHDYYNLIRDYPVTYNSFLPEENISYDNFGNDSTNKINGLKQNLISYDHYSKVNFVVVMETAFQTKKKHLTEKIFKPIIAGKPFILVAGANNLAYIKSYGFKTFENVINESYDTETNDKQRLTQIKSVLWDYVFNFEVTSVDCIHKLNEECHEIANFNQKWFWSDEFLKIVYKELIKNLHIATAKLSVMRNDDDAAISKEILASQDI